MVFLYILLMAVTLVVLLNWQPVLKSPAPVSAKEKQLIQKTYRWLRTSMFLTIPSMLFLVFFFQVTGSYRYDSLHRFGAVVLPLFWHIGIVWRLRTKNLFVFRHTQQALAFLILRAGTAMLALFAENLWLFVLVNGSLWFFGTWWGQRQLKHNTCWLMERNHEKIIVVDEANAAKIVCSSCGQPVADTDGFCPRCGHAFAAPNAAWAQTYLDEGLRLFVDGNDKKAATQKLLRAFQAGTPDIRQRALEALDKLGAVEKF